METYPLGDSAIVIRLGASIDDEVHRRVRAVCARLEERPVPGMVEYVPAFASVTVHYDPARVAGAAPPASPPSGARGGADGRTPAERGGPDVRESPYERMVAILAERLAGLEEIEPAPGRLVEIPVCYGGEYGPDLGFVAGHAGLSEERVAEIHAAGDYRVYMIGFMPGFPYLGGVSERIAAPRRRAPRTRVPAGSVGIAGRQTGVYPLESPGGWQIIGRTPARLFAPDADPPTLLRIGDRVRFRRVAPAEYASAEPRVLA